MQCWICGSTDEVKWKEGNGPGTLHSDDLKITDGRYGVTLSLWRCRHCGFIHADSEELGGLEKLYAGLIDEDYDESQAARVRQMRWLLDVADRVCPDARMALDVGAATGLLVREGRGRGLDLVGVEPSAALVELAGRRNGVELVHGVFPHPLLKGRVFDLVFLVDVIEHVSDPLALLRSCAGALAPGGVALVVTPDIGSRTARMMGQRWWHLRLAHVGYFSTQSFEEAAARAGLLVVEQLRARWFFPIEYLANRMENYLPVGWINRLSERFRPTRWLDRRAIPLNLHDSSVFVLKKPSS